MIKNVEEIEILEQYSCVRKECLCIHPSKKMSPCHRSVYVASERRSFSFVVFSSFVEGSPELEGVLRALHNTTQYTAWDGNMKIL